MIEEFCEQLYTQLEGEIEQIAIAKPTPLKRLNASLICIRKSLTDLKDYIIHNPLVDQQKEIDFFKQIKPKFYCLHIYHLEKYNIETSIPAGDSETLKIFYRDELKAFGRFFQHISFLYQYYRLGATELDSLYFVRGLEVQSVLLPEVQELDPEFATSCDYLFSKIKAYEMLQEYVVKALKHLDPSGSYSPVEEQELPELKWTGDKVNLVEVIYGLYFTGQLNNGNTDISVIIRFMEKHMQIDLSRAYRDFLDIRNRKKTSPTRYIEQMGESIHKRIDDDLTIKQVSKKHF